MGKIGLEKMRETPCYNPAPDPASVQPSPIADSPAGFCPSPSPFVLPRERPKLITPR
jgi:hypothetical protein